MTAVPDEKGRNGTRESANDRFKRSFEAWFWGSITAATVIHFGVLVLWPSMAVEDFSYDPAEVETLTLPPEVVIPPRPDEIARPATPVVPTAELEEDITISRTTFEANPVDSLPPPPEEAREDVSSGPAFAPYTVAPELLNRAEMKKALEREYPPFLRDAGIGGTVRVGFFIDENGKVQDTRIDERSGHNQLDEAALRVADVMHFSPALNRDKRVPVWISIPITFEVH